MLNYIFSERHMRRLYNQKRVDQEKSIDHEGGRKRLIGVGFSELGS